MKLKKYQILAAAIAFIAVLPGCTSINNTAELDPQNTWIVLIEKNYYGAGYSDLDIGHLNSRRLLGLFDSIGVPAENILQIRDELGEAEIRESMEWLLENAPDDAAVFYYIGAHGSYLRKRLRWNFLTPPQWNALPQQNKIMIVDSCNAGEFVAPFEEAEDSGITCGVVAADELNWWGIEEEGLPIIGSVWVNYFIEAFSEPAADINGDGRLGFTEAYQYADTAVQDYTAGYIFGNKDYLESYIRYGYDPDAGTAYPNAVMNNPLKRELILAEY